MLSFLFLKIKSQQFFAQNLLVLCVLHPLQLITQAMATMHCAIINSAAHIAPSGSLCVHLVQLFIAIF